MRWEELDSGGQPSLKRGVADRGFLTLELWASQVFFMASVFLRLQ